MTLDEKLTLIKVKHLLNNLAYIIKDEHDEIINDYHDICRKYASLDRK